MGNPGRSSGAFRCLAVAHIYYGRGYSVDVEGVSLVALCGQWMNRGQAEGVLLFRRVLLPLARLSLWLLPLSHSVGESVAECGGKGDWTACQMAGRKGCCALKGLRGLISHRKNTGRVLVRITETTQTRRRNVGTQKNNNNNNNK